MLAACGGDAKFKSTDVTGATFARDFHLTDHHGKPRTLADFKGKALVIFFGYTHCPDFCPTTLAEMAEALHRLGDKATEVQVLFVTLDPERDTSQILAQ
ncbi:MAG: SCO family protein, partial [Burkholderiales bacterium]